MVKITLQLMISSLLLSCGLNAMMSKEQAVPLSKDTAWLVHATHVFPRNNCIIAGSMLKMKRVKTSSDVINPLGTLYEQAGHSCTAWRNTVHWSLNSLVYPHTFVTATDNGSSQVFDAARDSYPYIIIEPLKAFQGKDLRGYWQDLYHLGGHQLSEDAVILVSSKDTNYKNFVEGFKGTILFYDAQQRLSVEQFLTDKKVPVLYPCMAREKVKNTWLHTKVAQTILLNGKEEMPNAVAKLLDLDNICPLSTKLGQFQKEIGEFLMELRSCQLIDTCWTQVVPNEDPVGLQRCVACKKIKAELPSKKLLACSRCSQATYCSAPCQKDHWANHKKSCELLKGCVAQVNHLRSRYLAQCKLLQETYDGFILDVGKTLMSIAESYNSKREQNIMKAYKAYIMELLALLYSPAPEYVQKRGAFDLETCEGFIAFCREIRRIVDRYESLLGADVHLSDLC